MTAIKGYFRQPTIHGDRVVFVCEDDLWEVAASGGVARRLTAGAGRCGFPLLSPGGSRIAYMGRADGPPELYVVDAGGGSPVRLTHTGTFATPVAWSADGKEICFHSNWNQPFQGATTLFAVPAGGGTPRSLDYGLARTISFQPGGRGVVLGRNTGDPARWKRYRGGTAGKLWIDRAGDGEFKPLVDLDGDLAGPMWIGSRIYFLADHEGHGNLYSCTPTGRGLKRHTHHDDFYVRFPSTDGRSIVYHAGADLFRFDVKEQRAERIDVELHSPRRDRNRTFVHAERYLEGTDLHPKGHTVACVARGAAFTMPLWEGSPVRHDSGSAERCRLATWLPDGKRLIAVSDARGEEELVLLRADRGAGRGRGPKRIRGDYGRVLALHPAPAGADRVALTNHRQELWLLDLKTGKGTRVEQSECDRIGGVAWSPDGRWLAYGFSVSRQASAIHLYDTRSGRIRAITRPDFIDFSPSFDPDGKFLCFLSHRVFDPIYDNQHFDLGFPRGILPCLVPLAATTPSPFASAMRTPKPPHGASDGPEEKEKEKAKGKDAKRPAPVAVDLAGIEDRVVAFPVEEGRYESIRAAHGRVFFTRLPVEGSLGQELMGAGGGPKEHLFYWDFEKLKLESLKEPVSGFRLSMDAKSLLLRVGSQLRVVSAQGDLKDLPSSEEPSRESGWLDLDRMRVAVEPGDEWRQMFREAWRLQRDQFWTPDMSQIDWQAVHDRYLPLVDRVGSRSEFSDLMWEMQGELGTSHCYEMGGDYRPGQAWFQGMLGADLVLDRRSRTWKVKRIPQGDSWVPEASSPLAAPGVRVKPGDEILSVNGERIGPKHSPFASLVNQAGCDVTLVVRRGAKGKPREVTVRTLRSEFTLRYRDWVETNRARVHKQSKGRVGYIHVPDMGPRGYAEFHRYFRQEMDHEGLIIDVRWNGGGHVSQLLLEKLARKRVGYDLSRWQGAMPYPSEAPMGPMVALTNEHAGSDGDIFSHCFKLYGLGPLIGKRTWGGVVGIWPRHALVDGTITTQPEFGFWFHDVGWNVENYGTDPDIEVDIRPQDHAAGKDPQLERGLQEIGKILKRVKPSVPLMGNRPKLTAPRLGRAPGRRG